MQTEQWHKQKKWHKILLAHVGMATCEQKKNKGKSHRMRVTLLCTQRLSACTLLSLYIGTKLKVKPVVQNRSPQIAGTRRISRKRNRL